MSNVLQKLKQSSQYAGPSQPIIDEIERLEDIEKNWRYYQDEFLPAQGFESITSMSVAVKEQQAEIERLQKEVKAAYLSGYVDAALKYIEIL